MSRRIPEPVRLSELKGISIYFEDDFYQAAELVLKLYDGKRERFNELGKGRPTVNGMIRLFCELSGTRTPKSAVVAREVAKRHFPLGASITFDHEE